jgi:antitoxin ChpS
MLTTHLRRVGGSTMLAVPKELLRALDLQPGSTVSVSLEGGRLVVEPQSRPRYTLAELLAASDYSESQSEDEREWVEAPAIGRELL